MSYNTYHPYTSSDLINALKEHGNIIRNRKFSDYKLEILEVQETTVTARYRDNKSSTLQFRTLKDYWLWNDDSSRMGLLKTQNEKSTAPRPYTPLTFGRAQEQHTIQGFISKNSSDNHIHHVKAFNVNGVFLTSVSDQVPFEYLKDHWMWADDYTPACVCTKTYSKEEAMKNWKIISARQ